MIELASPKQELTTLTSVQSPNAVIIVRPHYFQSNPQTLADNTFQQSTKESATLVSEKAYQEVTDVVNTLKQHGIKVHLFEDKTKDTPDSVFPNNWFTTHADGKLAVFPMYCDNRRKERREDILAFLQSQYQVQQLLDYSSYEKQGVFLEGTGAMVFDHINRFAYAVKSKRMDTELFKTFCNDFDYQAVAFNASDENGIDIYHTNVLMCIGTEFAMLGLSMLSDEIERDYVYNKLQDSGKEIIELSSEQIALFAGNALELDSKQGPVLVVSSTAYQALTPAQITKLEKMVKIVPLHVKTIEKAGGSIRCMLAGVHFKTR